MNNMIRNGTILKHVRSKKFSGIGTTGYQLRGVVDGGCTRPCGKVQGLILQRWCVDNRGLYACTIS
jgi:hypothetical protein